MKNNRHGGEGRDEVHAGRDELHPAPDRLPMPGDRRCVDAHVAALRAVLQGGIFVSPKVSSKIIEEFSNPRKGGDTPVSRLTDRELEIFRMIGEGHGSRDIAGKLNISVRTIGAHRAHIKEKLALRDATELVHRAVSWVKTGEWS